jgi:hypothetical protein
VAGLGAGLDRAGPGHLQPHQPGRPECPAPGGALIVYDAIINDDRVTNPFGLLISLNMLTETQAGFDYTATIQCTPIRPDHSHARTVSLRARMTGNQPMT